VTVVGDLAKELKTEREAHGQQLVYVLDRELALLSSFRLVELETSS